MPQIPSPPGRKREVKMDKKRRHKWKTIKHRYYHEAECEVCGCLKDMRILNGPIYTLKGERFYHAPDCKPITSENKTPEEGKEGGNG